MKLDQTTAEHALCVVVRGKNDCKAFASEPSLPKENGGPFKAAVAAFAAVRDLTADIAAVALRPVPRSHLHRRVPSKYDPVFYDLAVLLELKGLATPARWSGIEDCAENLLTDGRQHINIQVEQRLSTHAELLKNRALYKSYGTSSLASCRRLRRHNVG